MATSKNPHDNLTPNCQKTGDDNGFSSFLVKFNNSYSSLMVSHIVSIKYFSVLSHSNSKLTNSQMLPGSVNKQKNKLAGELDQYSILRAH